MKITKEELIKKYWERRAKEKNTLFREYEGKTPERFDSDMVERLSPNYRQ